jgi:hypothetical protein
MRLPFAAFLVAVLLVVESSGLGVSPATTVLPLLVTRADATQPSATIEPSRGHVGDTVIVVGRGWAPNQRISVSWPDLGFAAGSSGRSGADGMFRIT